MKIVSFGENLLLWSHMVSEYLPTRIAGWSSPVARQAHNLKVVGSNPAPATNLKGRSQLIPRLATALFLKGSFTITSHGKT